MADFSAINPFLKISKNGHKIKNPSARPIEVSPLNLKWQTDKIHKPVKNKINKSEVNLRTKISSKIPKIPNISQKK